MKVKNCAKRGIEQAIARLAKKSASIEANTACTFWGYQSQEPKQIKALRKF
ncbi:MAG: cyclic lactone autoinducer peptide [Lachnoclostridium sp.]|nr:cyclic lactone autoinducer peptide [Lachnospira sp.]MCM1248040.1 cyclic lactone autoinducer peptide [Lachnoclostridium sp.]MCM1535857.1 cyclic lactone autoinducer peptide [Clostridium sp.]